ncbi:hypothetical protein TURU_109438 [Turdus rufiventris]|nr:hypothetical protein TURU_109438 [Turdus rufiventris]
MLEKARQQLQEEILCVQSQLLDEKKKREHQEALVRRLQKRVVLLTKCSAERLFVIEHKNIITFLEVRNHNTTLSCDGLYPD